MITNFTEAKSFINQSRELSIHESISGPGSSVKNTTEARNLITTSIQKLQIKSILDLGCGDWNWFKLIDLTGVSYEGWDADEKMIESNIINYGRNNIRFSTYDIILSDYFDVDLIICRDVLFHMPINLAKKVIQKSKFSCKYFISTSFREVNYNKGIDENQNWGYYPINLNIDPFNLSEYEIEHKREMLGSDPNGVILTPKRYISLYNFTKFEKKY